MAEFLFGLFVGGMLGFIICALLMFDDWKGDK